MKVVGGLLLVGWVESTGAITGPAAGARRHQRQDDFRSNRPPHSNIFLDASQRALEQRLAAQQGVENNGRPS